MNAVGDKNPAKPQQNTFFSRVKTTFNPKEKDFFLKNWKSPFYFFLFVFILGMFWCIYGLVGNSFSNAYNWDYSHQYLPFAQSYHDTWRHFFSTGEFRLYDTVTFIGADNIGANAYYGLFDPFTIISAMFPRAWMPQLYAIFTVIKLTLCAGFARMYLKYRGISEGASRFGSVAIAFSGYLNFMVGFPTFVSALTYAPLVLYGIERVIKEKKIGALSIGIFFMTLSCFLLVVPMCIWGVIYAGFRYFVTIRERKWKDNLLVLFAGVLGFGIGLLLAAWVLIPSFRASASTGRTTSIGNAYMQALIEAIKAKNVHDLFRLLFLEVGENPGREIMGLVSFFYPTGGFQVLPLLRPGYSESLLAATSLSSYKNATYDAWSASLFCYTPFVILFFTGIIESIRRKKASHLIAIVCCVFLVFSTFAYYAFFGFSGNGYGRWYFVLIPAIVYYGCWAFDQRKDSPRYIPLLGALFALAGTFLSYFAIYWLLEGLTFSGNTYVTYYPTSFLMPGDDFQSLLRIWYLVYECALIIIETIVLLIGYRKKWLSHAMLIFIAAEVAALGNTGYYYVGLWSIENTYMGGSENLAISRRIAENIDEIGDPFFRVDFSTAQGTTNFQYAVGEPASSSFHSLINYRDTEFMYMNHAMSLPSSPSTHSYADSEITNYSWTGIYRDKRFGTDYSLGYRYYVVRNYPTDREEWMGESVPFGAEEVMEASPEYEEFMKNYPGSKYLRTKYRVYRVGEDYLPMLGHGVDKDYLYRMNKQSESRSDFYGAWSRNQSNVHYYNFRNGYITYRGAIVDDDVDLPSSFTFNTPPTHDSSPDRIFDFPLMTFSSSNGFKAKLYSVNSGDYFVPSKSHIREYGDDTMGYFFDHNAGVESLSGYTTMTCGKERMVLSPRKGKYFNEDEEGAYFQISYTPSSVSNDASKNMREQNGQNFLRQPRLIFFDENHNVIGYDGTTFGVAGAVGETKASYCGYTASCGFYAKGKVTDICVIWPTNTNLQEYVSPSNFIISVIPYSEFERNAEEMKTMGLKEVKKINNGYSFATDYPEETIVVTQLGYDDGWKVYASDEQGNKNELKTLRLDGGLQGFLAPEGKMAYEMIYRTPGLDLGLVLAAIGVGMYVTYFIISFVFDLRKTKKELSLTTDF